MQTGQAMQKRCGAVTKATGKPCRRPRGWGTDHPGSGRCKNHGGSTGNGQKAAAGERAEQHAARAMVELAHIDAGDSMLLAVYRSAAMADGYFQEYSHAEDGPVKDMLRREVRASTKEQAQIASWAITARVQERAREMVQRYAVLMARPVETGFAAVLARIVSGELQADDQAACMTAFGEECKRQLERLDPSVIEQQTIEARAIDR